MEKRDRDDGSQKKSEEKRAAGLFGERGESEAFARVTGLPGWHYRDLPNLSVENMERFKDVVGEDNLRWITFTNRVWRDGSMTQRGQVMISPEGMDRIARGDLLGGSGK